MSSNLVINCMVCGQQDNLKQCAQCKLVHFCGPEHQRSHWPSHKAVCKKIATLRKRLEKKQKAGHERFAELTGGLSLQFGGSMRDSIQYKEQLQLAEQELEVDTPVSIESALNHVVDLRNVSLRPLSDDVLEMATSCLIRLDRDQEAYNYLKYWTWGNKDHDRLEVPEIFEGKAPSAAFLAFVFLEKLRLLTAIDSARQCYIEEGDYFDPRVKTTLVKCGFEDAMKEGPELGDHLSTINFHFTRSYEEVVSTGGADAAGLLVQTGYCTRESGASPRQLRYGNPAGATLLSGLHRDSWQIRIPPVISNRHGVAHVGGSGGWSQTPKIPS
ncbi:hypothetical protein PMIN02_008220 [Paraphaeosphaeria minitans]|uniref:MYND finger n=1 Tax=Paraphaeosphaeria minitans TaxID=565426 RepID=A0A9P6G5H1_9PLEO|nr:MYND finger [Paraphaeosphaeria minitans]